MVVWVGLWWFGWVCGGLKEGSLWWFGKKLWRVCGGLVKVFEGLWGFVGVLVVNIYCGMWEFCCGTLRDGIL